MTKTQRTGSNEIKSGVQKLNTRLFTISSGVRTQEWRQLRARVDLWRFPAHGGLVGPDIHILFCHGLLLWVQHAGKHPDNGQV